MRCPKCGGLNSDDAQWCGQCFTRFPSPTEQQEIASVALASLTEEPRALVSGSVAETPAWVCPVCTATNPLDADYCERCKTPIFQALRASSARVLGSRGNPVLAAALSVVPGIGHVYLKRGGEAATRLLLTVWWLGTAFAVPSGAPASSMIRVMFVFSFVALAALSIADAHRQANDPSAPALLSGRLLLYWALGMLTLLATGLVMGFFGAAAA